MKIGQQLKQKRKENKLTLKDVAASTGLSISFLSDIERGKTLPSLATTQRLAMFYNVVVCIHGDTIVIYDV